MGAPELDAVIQVGVGVEGKSPLSGLAAFDTVQDMFGFLGYKCTLPGHIKLSIHQHPQVLHRAPLNPFFTQPVLVLRTALSHKQDRALLNVVRFTRQACTVPLEWLLFHTCSFLDDKVTFPLASARRVGKPLQPDT